MNRRWIIAGSLSLVVVLVLMLVIARAKKSSRPASTPVAENLWQTGLTWQSKDDTDQAIAAYQQLISQYPEDSKAEAALHKLARIYEQEKMWPEARDAYSKIIADFPNSQQIAAVEKKLWDLNIKLLFSPLVQEHDVIYKVEPADTLSKIAAQHNTTVDLIMRSNELDSDLIRVGQRLKISLAKFSVIVDKSQNSLTLKADDQIFKVYTVATGKHNCTPVGNFTIVEKLINPEWYKRGAGIIPADSPENILGSRWLGLSEPQYGIHGGGDDAVLGTQATDGCIRMADPEVEELFTILPRGTEVTVVD